MQAARTPPRPSPPEPEPPFLLRWYSLSRSNRPGRGGRRVERRAGARGRGRARGVGGEAGREAEEEGERARTGRERWE
eukprot:2003094-Rhodomonas_salina.1